jgi:hypothetical protein
MLLSKSTDCYVVIIFIVIVSRWALVVVADGYRFLFVPTDRFHHDKPFVGFFVSSCRIKSHCILIKLKSAITYTSKRDNSSEPWLLVEILIEKGFSRYARHAPDGINTIRPGRKMLYVQTVSQLRCAKRRCALVKDAVSVIRTKSAHSVGAATTSLRTF